MSKPPWSESHAAWLHRFLLGVGILLGLALAILVIWQAAAVLLLVFGGVLLAVLLRGCSRTLHHKLRLPLPLALTAVVAGLVGLVTAAVLFLSPSIGRQTRDLQTAITQTAHKLQHDLGDWPSFDLLPANNALPSPTPGYPSAAAPPPAAPQDISFQPDTSTVRDLFAGGTLLLRRLAGIFSTAFGVLTAVVIIMLVGVFLAADPQTYRDGLLRFLPVGRRRRVAEVLDEAEHVLRWWMVGQSVSMITVGVLISTGLWLLGVPMAPALGFLAALFTFVPYLGPIVSSVPGLLIAWSVSPTVLFYAFLLYVVVQNLEGWVLTPLVQQQAVHLPPALIVAAQMLAGIVWGVLGVIFATPLLAAAKLLIRRLYIEDVLGDSFDKPAVREGPAAEPLGSG